MQRPLYSLVSLEVRLFTQILIGIALLAFAAWIYLFLFRGNYWRCREISDDLTVTSPPAIWPDIAIIVPARNESKTIKPVLESLTGQLYEGQFRVFLVDDESTDGTGAMAQQVDPDGTTIEIIKGKPLQDGWTGKLWSLSQGISAANDRLPQAEFYLFTDADIRHDRNNLRVLVSEAMTDRLGLLSLMVQLRCRAAWESFLIPAFVYFFQKLYPFSWVNNPSRQTAGAAGGCMLVRRATLEAMGGLEIIKHAIIDDCALAAEIKRYAPVRLYLSKRASSLRPYNSLKDIWKMVRRTAFVQLNYSILTLIGTILGLIVIYGVPPAATIIGASIGNDQIWVPGLAAWILMSISYAPTLLRYGMPLWTSFFLPVAACLYTLMTIDSGRMYLFGKAPDWKGRRYATLHKTNRKPSGE